MIFWLITKDERIKLQAKLGFKSQFIVGPAESELEEDKILIRSITRIYRLFIYFKDNNSWSLTLWGRTCEQTWKLFWAVSLEMEVCGLPIEVHGTK